MYFIGTLYVICILGGYLKIEGETREERKLDTARKFKAAGIAAEVISQCTGLLPKRRCYPEQPLTAPKNAENLPR